MSLEGSVVIELACDGGRVQGARVTPPRPVALAPIMRGRPISEAIATIGLLFRVCGLAQSAASVEAAEAALGLTIDAPTRTARRLLVAAEVLREHLLRIAFDEAFLAGGQPDAGRLRRIMPLPGRLREALFQDADAFVPGVRAGVVGRAAYQVAAEAEELTHAVVSEADAELGTLDRHAFGDWARAGGTAAARLAAAVLARDWGMIGCPPQRPMEAGPDDTSCYARQHDAPLVLALLSEDGEAGLAARLAARFVEASKLPGELARGLEALQARPDPAGAPPDCPPDMGRRSGCASAEAARGRLEHRVVLSEDGLVADYAIVAPTSSHFGDRGIAARSLAALSARTREELAVQVDLLIRTIDPCVGYQVRFN